MRVRQIPLVVGTLLLFVGINLQETSVQAAHLAQSDSRSTLPLQCDLCWNPSSNEQSTDRLPTFKGHRPRRPPDSRPHRYPKGRYKLVPGQKLSRLSILRARLRHNARLAGSQQIIAIDGDTLRVGSDRVRLRGIDTPELSEPEGEAAKRRLAELLRSGPVRIVPRGRDVYDRLIADVFVHGQDVAEILKSEGFAKAE